MLEVLRRGGRYAVSGAIAGPMVELDLRTLYLKDLRLLGCTILEPQLFTNLVGYIERGEIRTADSYRLAISIAAVVREIILHRIVDREPPPIEDDVRFAVDFIMRGVENT